METSEPTVAPAGGSQQALQPTVCPGPGLPLIPRRVAEQIKRNEYVDFAELPPAKGKGKLPAHGLEGQVVVVQAADLVRSRRIIPDLATWLQCYAIYVAVKGTQQPASIPELMAYQAVIAKASRKFKWPSWIVYDQNFRQEAAGNPSQSWVKVEPSLYAQCFTGQEVQGEGWCTTCQGVDHSTADCPFQPRKRPRLAMASSNPPPRGAKTSEVCQKFNRFGGDCSYGRKCKFAHVCEVCKGPHPVSRCRSRPGPSQMQKEGGAPAWEQNIA